METLNEASLQWFAQTIFRCLDERFLSDDCVSSSTHTVTPTGCKDGKLDDNKRHQQNQKTSFIVIHGAGSFGHHTAKEYGLRGRSSPPPSNESAKNPSKSEKKKLITGLAKTRHR